MRMETDLNTIVSRLGWDDVEPGRHQVASARPVVHVDRVVLAVVAPEAEEDRRPLAIAQPLLLERAVEVELAADELVIAPRLLRHAVHEHPDRRLGARR